MWGRKERVVDSWVLADIEQQGAVPLHGQVGTNALPTRLVWAVNAVCLFVMKIKMSEIIALKCLSPGENHQFRPAVGRLSLPFSHNMGSPAKSLTMD